MTARQGVYLDSCVLLSLFLADSGYGAAEQWLRLQGEAAILVSHWLLVEVAAMLCIWPSPNANSSPWPRPTGA